MNARDHNDEKANLANLSGQTIAITIKRVLIKRVIFGRGIIDRAVRNFKIKIKTSQREKGKSRCSQRIKLINIFNRSEFNDANTFKS